jgi:hypothetical protein
MSKRYLLILAVWLIVAFVFLAGCAPQSAAAPATTEPPTQAPATATAVIPTPTPTEEPVLPCDIAFDSDRDGNHEIYTMAPDGSGQVNLTNDPADDSDPVWSPDGTHIAFTSDRQEGDRYIYIMKSDGTDVTQVSQQNDAHSPDWSPLGSQLVYVSQQDIYLMNLFEGTEVRLTDSPEADNSPKFSPDGQRIAWLMGEGDESTLYVMNLDGSNVTQVTSGGPANDVEWSVDGRLFTHWSQPDGICFNCVVTADGKEVIDGGGKGTIQQFLPFWTDEGDRVELGAGDINGTGHDDIFLVGENFPDIFFYLTSDSGNNRNPDAAAMCGPTHGVYPQYEEETAAEPTQDAAADHSLIFGYTGDFTEQMQQDLDLACSELGLECVKGDSIAALAEQKVDAIIAGSNRWAVMGDYLQIHEAAGQGIPIFLLNAESSEPGVYNLSAEYEIYNSTLRWMFDGMNGQGEFVYYNFGNSDYIQQIVEATLKDYPGITAVKKDADYEGNSFTQADIVDLIAQSPDVGAIWSSELSNDLFWGVNDKQNKYMPLMECPARQDIFTAWKGELDNGSKFQCIAHIRPGGVAYEGVYAAYYYLSGYQFDPDAFTVPGGNTFKYEIPTITSANLSDWIDKSVSFRVGNGEALLFPPMNPDEIKARWFVE